jgi:two-component system CheB/CheR fusion protein
MANLSSLPVPRPRPARVCVVEDNLDAALTLVDLLEIWGYEVRAVHDGLSAVTAVPEFHPDVLLLDIGLPGIDGYEVARRLRRRAELDGLLIVAVTGYGQDDDRQRAREAGFDHHLVKPLDLEALRRLLADAPRLD